LTRFQTRAYHVGPGVGVAALPKRRSAMEFDPQERAVIQAYLQLSGKAGRRWLVVLALGAVVCLVALLMLVLAPHARLSFVLLALVAGLVIMARALDERNRAILARIMQKYHRAAGEGR